MGRRSNGSVVRRRRLGRALRELREAAGLSVEVAAPQLDWSSSKLSRIENGQQRVDVHGVRSMLDLYDAGGERWTELTEPARQCHQKGWWRAFGLDDQGYVPLEAEATLVRDFLPLYIPGLLQTAEYARAVFHTAVDPLTPAQIDRYVRVRVRRQQRLTAEDDPLELVAIVDQAALHRLVGGRDVMRAQLAHLIEASALPTVTLQVVPWEAGAHAGMSAGISLLRFGDLDMPDLAYTENPIGSIHMEKEGDVARAARTFDRLRSQALSPADSVGLVRRVAEQM
ncbi:MAG TPA: helix-turn-helix transcriptional regulator [Pseudonocardia sp.]|nr:helix-turn-helix transcriptional regulator [Pseudonocardia sp.]